ncbi:hypothetical protein L6452_39858 [Arctium lappa]|uniref:Uncharacterized protein n=1 Tax=Arctium lappa TaxID=4217 RepID=A0ACB8XUB1_ARCLA|nr:hypothetical protein L6452_39858 [Arctium lappa]
MLHSIKLSLPRLSSFSSQLTHTTTTAMEIEVKLRLPDSAAHQKLSDVLSPHHTKTHLQQNLFFDTPTLTLATDHLAALRLRFHDLDSHSLLTLKSTPTTSNGITRVHESEHPLVPAIARACAVEPSRFADIAGDSGILTRVAGEFGVDLRELVCLGGFRNVRAVYDWNGLKLELDETMFEFGVNYEIECESDDPDEAKLKIEELLNSNGIGFSYSEVSKFAIFRAGKLPDFNDNK